jgi:hypothetical protein
VREGKETSGMTESRMVYPGIGGGEEKGCGKREEVGVFIRWTMK